MRLLLGLIESVLWVTGIMLVGLFAGELGVQELQRINAVAAFRSTQTVSNIARDEVPPVVSMLPGDDVSGVPDSTSSSGQVGFVDYEAPPPDQTLWSSGRIADFAASLTQGPTLV